MNRENKRKTFEKNYYKNHACKETFICKACGREVVPAGAGSDHRNHCPNCLTSLHVDDSPGDRSSDCGGHMEPIAVWVKKNGEWALVHRCRQHEYQLSRRVNMSEIFSETNMEQILGEYIPAGETLSAGIHAIAKETDIKGVFGKCIRTESQLIPDENEELLF